MAASTQPQETTLWIDGDRAAVAGAVVETMGPALSVLAVGGPRESAVDRLAHELERPRIDDLRKLLVDYPATYLLIATRSTISAELLAVAAEQQTTVVTLEPVAGSLAEWASLGQPLSEATVPPTRPILPRIVNMPAFLDGPGFFRAAEPGESLGPGRLISFHATGVAEQGSLLSRLFDAWRTILHFADTPESIDASLAGSAVVPDALRQAKGRLGAHARMPDGAGATLAVTDRAGRAERRLEAIGEQAHLTVTDTDYTLHQIGGALIDHHRSPEGPMSYVALIADQWHRLIDRPKTPRGKTDAIQQARALACCEASLLSARTGQAESPRKLMEMHR